jgi:catechol 2,3-dioxygenase
MSDSMTQGVQTGERYLLPAQTRLGTVRLQVADLERSLAYYQQVLGFRVMERAEGRAVLGAHGGDAAIVELHERPGASPSPHHGRLGLYHYAILLPDRAALGRFLAHLGQRGERAGMSDHLVSEAIYLHDPDGLGIEVYADRPRAEWPRSGGRIVMDSKPIDVQGLLRAAGGEAWTGMPAGTTMGHVHLHVGDLHDAAAFYVGGLGLEEVVEWSGALFMSAGGYHHHLGTNTWAGAGAVPPGAGDARLLEWSIELPDDQSLSAARESLARAGYSSEPEGPAQVVTQDPWGTRLRFMAGGTTRE